MNNKKRIFKVVRNFFDWQYADNVNYAERREIIPMRIGENVMEYIVYEGNDNPFIITSVHELDAIWLYKELQKCSILFEEKIGKLKSVFPQIREDNDFDVEIIIEMEKEDGSWKDISSMDLDSEDPDISSWGGFTSFSGKVCDVIGSI